ncbi:hypothetical protein JOF56_003147 [Kibdelosporangium banguiense]|uniref:MYXO-CTERM domain-containing protein n=1 Tax=Kibdelosporangium banguiense TaxID=1365924 RepID=A0ABS4TEC0_9PSEU|nr:hypothetical protein [Kibdelosporangium banguiense]MBP2322762.1 hypothetical protein [Kibdelosporangium banguiense]
MVRAVVACALVVLFFLPVGAANAAVQPHVQLAPFAQQTATAPAGPTIETPPTEQDAANSRQRLVIGVIAVVLLGIVILGHRARAKRKAK